MLLFIVDLQVCDATIRRPASPIPYKRGAANVRRPESVFNRSEATARPQTHNRHSFCTSYSYRRQGLTMEINFRHDVDNVLKEASQLNKPVLLDFSAAPM
jgi:hypothetical protein